jgi:hypothetical protein
VRRSVGADGAFASWVVRGGFLALACAVLCSGPALADSEHMLLPYQCTFERGRVALNPSLDKAYRIVGPRASHAFTACAPSNPNRCRTWQIHKFDFICAGQRVPWLAVVAALLERAPQRGRIDNGRLMLKLGPEWQRNDVVPAGFRHPFGVAAEMLAFPAGYAPSLGSGARFIGSTNPPPTVVDARPGPKSKAEMPTETKAEPKPIKVQPRPVAAAESPSKTQEGTIRDGWIATVTPTLPADVLGTPTNTLILRGFIGLAAVFMAWAGLLFVRRRAVTAGATQRALPTSSPADDAALCAELVARAVNLHQAAQLAVGALPNANLREILAKDLAAVHRRLLSSALTADVADERWDIVKPVISKALVDLERIARIIAGVLSSQPAPPQTAAPLMATAAVPETTHEAFEVLGVNPEASRTVVKKVVDGLRQSWHPDHARDADDRARREERMKQINTAWDIIRSERDAASAERAA